MAISIEAFSLETNPNNVKVLLNDKNQRRVRNVVFSEVFDFLRNPVEVRDEIHMLAGDQHAELAEDDFGCEPQGFVTEKEENGPTLGGDE